MSRASHDFSTPLAKRFDYYGFPRTGSHYLWACFTGLFDLVFFPNAFVKDPEAMQRADELNPHAFYALRLRDEAVPYQPIYINAAPRGVHGTPAAGAWPVIILIRDPHPTIFSYFYTATERWGATIPDRVAWMRKVYKQYRNFYDAALALVEKDPSRSFLIRFEQLKHDPAILTDLVRFVGVQPKLAPVFVHWWTDFKRMTKPGNRTFYRVGNNTHWRTDDAWQGDLAKANPGNFRRYGYPSDQPLPSKLPIALNPLNPDFSKRAAKYLRRVLLGG